VEAFWRNAGVQLGKHWKLVLLALAVITVVLGVGLTRNEFATGQDSYLNPDSQVAIDNEGFQEEFGGEAIILLFEATGDADITDLFLGANLEEQRRITAALGEIENVASVVTPLNALTFSDALVTGPGQTALLAAPARDEAGADVRSDDISRSFARLGLVPPEEQVLDPAVGGAQPNPDWIDLLIFASDGYEVTDGVVTPPPLDDKQIRLSLAGTFPDDQGPVTAVGGVVLEGNLDLDAQGQATNDVLEVLDGATFENFDLTVTGSPVYLKEINDYLKGGMLTLGLAAMAVMAVVLGVMFRVRWRLLPLLAVIIGVLWTFSILGLIGIDLSLVTISGLPILIGLGIDFAIQIHNRVEEEVVLDNDEHPIAETVANLAPPLIAAALAGVVAFIALQLSKVPMIRDFGVLLMIGVAVLVSVGIVVPASLLGIREWRSRTAERGDSVVERIVVWLGSLPTKAGLVLVVVSIFLFVGGILVEGRTRIESDPLRWIDQDSQVVEDVDHLTDRTGFASTMGVLVQANNVYDQQVIDLLWDFTLAAEQRPEVVTTSSLVNTMGKILMVDGATPIPPSEGDIAAAADVAPPDIKAALVNDDQTAAQVNLRLAAGSLEDRADLVEELQADLDARIDALDIPADSILLTDLPDGQEPVRATPAGLAVVGIGLLENLSANRAALTYFSLCLAGLYLILRFRSLPRALLALVPVFLGVGASSLIVGLLGIELSPLTTVSGPLIIASCTEFSVLILGRYLEERQDGLDPRTASDTAAARTGRAFFTSACTTIGGFAVLMVSPLPLLRDFGIIVTLNVAIALLAALVVMPPMMVWVDIRGWLATEQQIDPDRSVRLAADVDGAQAIAFGVGTVAFAGAAVGVYALADTSEDTSQEFAYAAVALPTTTTTSTTSTTTTTVPPTTVPGQTAPPTSEATGTTAPTGPEVDPAQFPDTPPPGAIAPVLFTLLTDQGVPGNQAHCAIVTAYSIVDEQTLLAMGVADGNPEALDVLREGSRMCGIPDEQVEAAIAQQFG
jgi:predicted RND superfamily exporter protein